MDNFLLAVNATMPIFLVIALGYFLRRIGLINKAFCDVGDKFVFKCALPVLVFEDLRAMDVYTSFDWKFVIFCAVFTFIMFFGIWGLARVFLKDKSLVGAFSQASARSSAAILGVALARNIYGDDGLVPLMIIAAVPLFNICSVIILTFSAEDTSGSGSRIKRTAINIAKNPIIIGIVLGAAASLIRLELPTILSRAVNNVGGLASPLALIIVGATFEGTKAVKKIKPTLWATAIKLLILPAIGLTCGAALGFSGPAMVAILIMTGSPTTVTCYIMAKNMGNDPVLSSSIVVMATLLSSVTLTMWIYVLKSLALI